MKRNNDYILRKIAGVPYLLPFGQTAADRKRGIQLNETGVHLWNLLEKDLTRKELLYLWAAHYDASLEDIPMLQKDLEQFLWNLTAHGILTDPETGTETHPRPASVFGYLEVGGLCLKFIGPREAFSDAFQAFLTKEPAADSGVHQTVALHMGSPATYRNGSLLLRDPQLVVIDDESHYTLFFPAGRQLKEAHLTKDASWVDFYYIPPCTDTLRDELFHAIRLTYLYLAQKHRMAALHSASILYKDRAWLFSGPSGTGKSTHSNLWHRLLQTPLINGDLNLLAVSQERADHGQIDHGQTDHRQPLVHGLPWCGTSGIYDTNTYPLGGIILLRQARENRIEELPPDKKRLLVMQRLISPSWTAGLLDSNLQFVHDLADPILICRLHCTMEDEAVKVMKARIDAWIEQGF